MPPEVEHREDVGEGELELQREAHHVEIATAAVRLELSERQSPLAELGLHVDPRAEGPLGKQIRVSLLRIV